MEQSHSSVPNSQSSKENYFRQSQLIVREYEHSKLQRIIDESEELSEYEQQKKQVEQFELENQRHCMRARGFISPC